MLPPAVSNWSNIADKWSRRWSDGYATTAEMRWPVGAADHARALAVFVVNAGLEFDVSIPRWVPAWVLDRHDPRFRRAAAFHDTLRRRGINRRVAGAIFHEILMTDGARAWQRLAMWLAVSLYRYPRG